MQFFSQIKEAFDPYKDKIVQNAKKVQIKVQKAQEQYGPQVYDIIKNYVLPNPFIIQIEDRIHYMPLPSDDKLLDASGFIKSSFGNNFTIWNIGEYKYDNQIFNNLVKEFNMVGYPCPPLGTIISICKSILVYLDQDPNNQAIINCQTSQGRSVLLISCLLCLLKKYDHPMEAVCMIAEKLKTDELKILVPSQKLYIKYFVNIKNQLKMNLRTIKIKKMMINTIPINFEKFKPYLQIYQNKEVVFSSLQKQNHQYTCEDSAILFDIDFDVDPEQDLLIRCKHYQDKNTRIPVFRLMFNTGFIFDEVLRFNIQDIELSPFFQSKNDFFVDFYMQHLDSKKEESSLQQMYKQIESSELFESYPNISDILKSKQNQDNIQDFSLNEDEKSYEMKELKIEDKSTKNDTNTTSKIDKINKQDKKNSVELEKEAQENIKFSDDIEQLKDDEQEIFDKITQNLKDDPSKDQDEKQDEEEEDLDDYISKLENS